MIKKLASGVGWTRSLVSGAQANNNELWQPPPPPKFEYSYAVWEHGPTPRQRQARGHCGHEVTVVAADLDQEGAGRCLNREVLWMEHHGGRRTVPQAESSKAGTQGQAGSGAGRKDRRRSSLDKQIGTD